MKFKSVQIDNFVKHPDAAIKAILVYGGNEGLVRDTIKRLAKSVCEDLQDAFRVAALAGEAVASDFGLLYGEYNGQSLMGGKRVIIVNNAGNDLSKELRKMLDGSNSQNLLLLSGSASLSTKSSLVKLAESSSDMAAFGCYDDKDSDIAAALRKTGLTFDPAALQLLYAKLSGDRMINLGELDKLVVYMGTAKNVTSEIVNKVISDSADSSAEDICYAALEGDRVKAQNFFDRYINEGNNPVSVLSSLTLQLMKLLLCRAGIEKGETAESAMESRLMPKIIFYRKDGFKRQLLCWNRDKLLRALELVFEAERDCKTTNMPELEIVGATLLRLAVAAKR